MVCLLITLQRSAHKVTRALPGSYICDKPTRWRNLRILGWPFEFQFLPLSDKHTLPEQGACHATHSFLLREGGFPTGATENPLPLYTFSALPIP